MNGYSSLFTSGLMTLCEASPRSRPQSCFEDEASHGMRSFLDMAESLRAVASGSSSSPTSSRAHSRKPSSDRRTRAISTSSKPIKVSPMTTRRRSLPQPKPAPLAELPVLPTIAHSRPSSEVTTSPTAPVFSVSPAPTEPGKAKEHLAPSSLKLELSSAPTTPGSRFPTTPTSSRAFSMFSPMTSPSLDAPWFPNMEPTSPVDTWVDHFMSALSPTTTESALGLNFSHNIPSLSALLEGENVAPLPESSVAPKRARARRPDHRHTAPSRNTSVTANSMRSSQGSVTTSYRKGQRNAALSRLEGRQQRSEWMSDDDEGPRSGKYQQVLSLMPSMDCKSERTFPSIPSNVRHQLAPFRTEDLNASFIDLSDDVVSRRGVSSFAT